MLGEDETALVVFLKMIAGLGKKKGSNIYHWAI